MALIYGSNLSNVLLGTNDADAISGFAGDDVLIGLAGNDSLRGGLGADVMVGGTGNDTYYVDDAGDVVAEEPGGGIDRIVSSISLRLNVSGRLDVETLSLTGFADIDATGNSLNNSLFGNAGDNVIRGLGGDDRLFGRGGNDVLIGDSGNDALNGGTGRDIMYGGAGNDTYVVDDRHDRVFESGGGIDRVVSSASYSLDTTGRFAIENISLTGALDITAVGNALANVITGNSGDNRLFGLDGNDALYGHAGNDRLFGGNGDDVLLGGLGNDVIVGAAGNDTIEGQEGADTILTGSGSDHVLFRSPLGAGNIDNVLDFAAGVDQFFLSSAVFTGLTAGVLAANAFVTGTAAGDADDRIIYDDAAGSLFFDADGTGGTAQVQFATTAAGLALSNNDFIVI